MWAKTEAAVVAAAAAVADSRCDWWVHLTLAKAAAAADCRYSRWLGLMWAKAVAPWRATAAPAAAAAAGEWVPQAQQRWVPRTPAAGAAGNGREAAAASAPSLCPALQAGRLTPADCSPAAPVAAAVLLPPAAGAAGSGRAAASAPGPCCSAFRGGLMGPWGWDPAAAAARMLLHVAAAACPGPAGVPVACPRDLGVCWGLLRCRRWSVLAWPVVAGLVGAAVLACMPCQGLLLLLLLLLLLELCCRRLRGETPARASGCCCPPQEGVRAWGRSRRAPASAAWGCQSQMPSGLVILTGQHCWAQAQPLQQQQQQLFERSLSQLLLVGQLQRARHRTWHPLLLCWAP